MKLDSTPEDQEETSKPAVPLWISYGFSYKSSDLSNIDCKTFKHAEQNGVEVNKPKEPPIPRKKTKGVFDEDIKADVSKDLDMKWMRKSNHHYFQEQEKQVKRDKEIFLKRKYGKKLIEEMMKKEIERMYKKQLKELQKKLMFGAPN